MNVKQRRNFNTIIVKQIVFFLFLVSKRAVVKNQIQNKSLPNRAVIRMSCIFDEVVPKIISFKSIGFILLLLDLPLFYGHGTRMVWI